MKLSLVRLSGGDADVPAHIRQQMATNWYVRHFNSYTTRGRANSVIAVIGAKQIASEPAKQAAPAPHASSAQKGGHH
ncbi:unnamed protein product [Rotaria magnacalcarata]|uniref:Uncharacterized protein n=1 Tax=Rotaria magnacalcarata TaxID=392030 RepID=A0A816DQV6_9BILA|nr:unnamed protein product [Rotaria magnacalcarata]